MDIQKVKKVHMIGIGGIGMSALAKLFLQDKKQVTGSDGQPSLITDGLEELGIPVSYERGEHNIDSKTDLFVYTEAIPKDHPERVAAEKTGQPMMNYFQALALAVNPYYLIAIAGTHGKTTTTAMLADVFEEAEKDPTVVIGSLRSKTGSNYRAGKSKYAIVEACEFRRDFLHLTPDVLVITNLEHEHVDYYKDLADVQSAFAELVGKVHDTGVIVTDSSHPNIAPILKDTSVPVIDYTQYIDLQLPLKQPGLHNRQNAAAALAVAAYEKLPKETARQAVSEFAGTWRRFEYKGKVNLPAHAGGAPVYDDYAHHPTEIRAAMSGARELYPDKRIIAIFQPHTYSRTKALYTDFAKAFVDADKVIVAPIYAAREDKDESVSVRELAVKMLEYTPQAQYIEKFSDIVKTVKAKAGENDVVVVLGAGPITEVATELTK